VSLLTDFRNLIQDLLVFQRTLHDLEVKVDKLSQENVALRHDLIRTQHELHSLREQLDLRAPTAHPANTRGKAAASDKTLGVDSTALQ